MTLAKDVDPVVSVNFTGDAISPIDVVAVIPVRYDSGACQASPCFAKRRGP
jgi:hypothetical protein